VVWPSAHSIAAAKSLATFAVSLSGNNRGRARGDLVRRVAVVVPCPASTSPYPTAMVRPQLIEGVGVKPVDASGASSASDTEMVFSPAAV
jgi:hypothetical protein